MCFVSIMDHSTKALKDITEGEDYVRVPNVAVFDAHDEFDSAGNLVRRFGKSELQEICDTTNARCEAGDLSLLTYGHTIPDAPEEKQPQPRGYANNFQVNEFGPEKRLGILCDFYVKKSEEKGFRTFPRRSVELWPKSKIIDLIALLRQAPERDLGLLTYSKGSFVKHRPDARFYSRPTRKALLAAAMRDEKLYYSMEAHMPMDPTNAPDAQDPDNDFYTKCDRYMKDRYPMLSRMHDEAAERYGPEGGPGEGMDDLPENGPGIGGAGNDFIPGAGDDLPPKKKPDEALRMKKDSEAIRYARLEKELAAIKAERDAEKLSYSKSDAERRVVQLEAEFISLDREYEVGEFTKTPMDKRDDRMERLRKYSRREGNGEVPTGAFLDVAPSPLRSAAPGITREMRSAATTLASREGLSFDAALAKIKK